MLWGRWNLSECDTFACRAININKEHGTASRAYCLHISARDASPPHTYFHNAVSRTHHQPKHKHNGVESCSTQHERCMVCLQEYATTPHFAHVFIVSEELQATNINVCPENRFATISPNRTATRARHRKRITITAQHTPCSPHNWSSRVFCAIYFPYIKCTRSVTASKRARLNARAVCGR